MNLFNSPTISELSALIAKCDDCSNYFNVMVDYDGEVLLSGNLPSLNKKISKYKFHICGLRGKAFVGMLAVNNLTYLNQLYKNLLYCWEKDLRGNIDYDKATRVQNLNYWLESNRIPKASIENDILSIFFRNNLSINDRPANYV